MQTITTVLKAIAVLEPLISEVVKYLNGGPEPEFMTTLPNTLRSRVAIEARKARAS